MAEKSEVLPETLLVRDLRNSTVTDFRFAMTSFDL